MKAFILLLALFAPFSLYTANSQLAKVVDYNELECLARNIYHEARGEPELGQIAVAHVTVNRLKTEGFPDTLCRVVYQAKQFSWVHQLKKHSPSDLLAYKRAKQVALYVLHGAPDPTKGATFYHNNTVRPSWSTKFKSTATIGSHKFYRQ